MYQCRLLVCAEEVIIDRTTNNVSLINLLEEFSAVGFPAVKQKICVFTLLAREPTDPNTVTGTLVAKIGEEEILRGEAQFDFADKPRNRHTSRIAGLVVQTPGVLKFSLILNGVEVGSHSIMVRGPAPRIDAPAHTEP